MCSSFQDCVYKRSTENPPRYVLQSPEAEPVEDGARDFFFPVGVMLEDEDSIVIGAHIKDMVSVLFRLTGLRDLLSTVMRLDSTETGKGNGNQPLVMSIQEYLVQRAQQKKWNSTVNI